VGADQPASRRAIAASEYIAVVAKTFIYLWVQDETAGARTDRIEARPLTRCHRNAGSSAVTGHPVREVVR
jgi:hypothetical protein